MIQIDSSRSGTEISVAIGEQLEVSLFENPTAGYRWRLIADGTPCLAVESDQFQLQSNAAVGRGGTHEWRFRAASAGCETITLEYARSWENKAIETFTLAVHVRPD